MWRGRKIGRKLDRVRQVTDDMRRQAAEWRIRCMRATYALSSHKFVQGHFIHTYVQYHRIKHTYKARKVDIIPVLLCGRNHPIPSSVGYVMERYLPGYVEKEMWLDNRT